MLGDIKMIEGILLILVGYGAGLLAMRMYDIHLLKLNGYHWKKIVKR
jgi:hypothetical protein